jgi:hypothetical protein
MHSGINRRGRHVPSKIAQFLSIILTALALIPGGAHLFELPNKIAMTETAYFTAQQIYRGWAILGVVIVTALIANLVAAVLARHARIAARLSIMAALFVAATLVIFGVWTFPANQATVNWTVVPNDWQALRMQWEMSHAASAVIMFLSLCCATAAATLARNREL